MNKQVSQQLPWSALIIALLVFVFIGQERLQLDVVGTGESRAGQLAREMQQNNQYMLPSMRGKISTQSVTKPPLYHWLLISTAGQLNWQNYSLRLVSIMAALAGFLLIFKLAQRMFSSATGIIAAIVLSVSILQITYSFSGRMDLTFALFLSASLWAFYNGLIKEDPSFYTTAGYIFMGLSIMVKGPVGLILPLLTMTLFLFFSGNKSRFGEFFSWKYFILLFAITLPWYSYVVMNAPDEIVHHMFLGEPENWLIDEADTGPGSRWYYYPLILIVGLFPWSFFLPGAFYQAIKNVWQEKNKGLLFLLIWVILGLIIFSIGGKKTPRYILPILIPTSILIAWHWQQLFIQRGSKKLSYQLSGTLIAVCGIAIGGLGLWVAYDPQLANSILSGNHNATETADRNLLWQVLTQQSILLGMSSAAIVIVSLISWPLFFKQTLKTHLIGYSSITWILMVFYFNVVEPYKVDAESPRLAAEYIRNCTDEGQLIHGGGDAYHHAFLWYFNRPFEQKTNQQLEQTLRENKGIPVFILHRHPLSDDILKDYPSVSWQDPLRTIHFFPTRSCE